MATEIKKRALFPSSGGDPDENLDDASDRFDEIGEGVPKALTSPCPRDSPVFAQPGHNATLLQSNCYFNFMCVRPEMWLYTAEDWDTRRSVLLITKHAGLGER